MPKKKTQPERQVHNSILEYFSTLKNYTFYTFDRKGSYDPVKKVFRKIKHKWEREDIKPLDIVGWHHLTGKIIWFEVKLDNTATTTKTYPDKEQRGFIEHCQNTNAFVAVLRSITDAKREIKNFEGLCITGLI